MKRPLSFLILIPFLFTATALPLLPAQAMEEQKRSEAEIRADYNASPTTYENISLNLSDASAISETRHGIASANGFTIESGRTEATLLSEPLAIPLLNADPFLAVAGSWQADGKYPGQVDFDFSFSNDGHQWSDWEHTHEGHGSIDDGLHHGDLIFADRDSRYVRFRLIVRRGEDGSLPLISSTSLHFISPGASDEALLKEMEELARDPGREHYVPDSFDKEKKGLEAAKYPRPSYVSRSSWGNLSNTASRSTTTVTHLVVHHSAANSTSSDFAAVVRSYWRYHTQTLGWSDIGYNWLVDRNGVRYQGRAFATNGNTNVIGAHAAGFNSNSMGICYIGNWGSTTPPATGVRSMERILAWKADERNINPTARTRHPATGWTRNTICGHRDVGSTSCPGQRLYNLLPTIRTNTKNLIDSGGAPPPPSTGHIEGRVFHGEFDGSYGDNRRIENATVRLNTGASTSTDHVGRYRFEVSPGTYTVTASKSGYRSASTTMTLSSAGSEVTDGRIRLAPEGDMVWARMGSGAPGTTPSWFEEHANRGLGLYWSARQPILLVQSAQFQSSNVSVRFLDGLTGDETVARRLDIEGHKLQIDGHNVGRTAETIILYDRDHGSDTGTNQFGIEIGMTLKSTSGNTKSYEVAHIERGQGGMSIPNTNYAVISAHGSRRDYLRALQDAGVLAVGSTVTIQERSGLNLSGYASGGIFYLSDVAVSDDNKIFVANYSRSTDSYGRFRVYMFDNLVDDEPLRVIDDTRISEQWQLSRTITIRGSYSEGTAALYAVSDGTTKAVLRYTQSGPGQSFKTTPEVISLEVGGLNPTASGVSANPSGSDIFYQTARSERVYRYRDGERRGILSSDLLTDYAHRVQYIGKDNSANEYIGVYSTHITSDNSREYHRAKLVKIPGGSSSLAAVVKSTRVWSYNENPNYGGDAHFFYRNGGFDVWVLSTNNGLSYSRLEYSVNIPDRVLIPDNEPIDMPDVDPLPDPEPEPDPEPDPTPGMISSLPWSEDFSGVAPDGDHGTQLPEGWAKIGDVQTSKWGGTNNSTTNLRFPSPTESPIAITPEIDSDISISGLKLTFKAHFATAGDSGDKIHIGFISNPSDASTFKLVESVSIDAAFKEYTVSLAGHNSGDGRRIAFKAERGGTWNAHYLGKVGLEAGESTPDPGPDPDAITEIPYTEDFSGVSVPDFPTGWARTGTAVTRDEWTALGGITIDFGMPIEDGPMAILPPIHTDIDISKLELTFNAYATTIYDIDHIKVGFVSDPANPSTFTLVEEVKLSTDVKEYKVKLDNHVASAGRRIGFQAESGGAWNRFFIGEVELDDGATPVVSSEGEREIPDELELFQNYPNPFNPVTIITYGISESSRVRLAVYDLTGRKIALLADEHQSPGRYEASWNASQMASGVYIYRLEAEGQTLTRRMTLVK